MTGECTWFGAQMVRGAELAVADINAAGGVLEIAPLAQDLPDAGNRQNAAAIAFEGAWWVRCATPDAGGRASAG
jgi:ABC-type branched-subunit amino acid transport system substrate-binding protein